MKILNIIVFSLFATKALQGICTDDVFNAFENGKISDAQMEIFDKNEETKLLASLIQSFLERLETAPNFEEKMQVIYNLNCLDKNNLKKFIFLGSKFLSRINPYAPSYEEWCKCIK